MLLTGDSARETVDRLRFARARRSICELGGLTIPKYKASWHHVVKCAAIEDVIRFARHGGKRGGVARLLISEPPQHGKSLHAGKLAPALALGQDPDLTVMGTAYNSELAGRAVEETRDIMSHENYLAAFSTRIGKQVDGRTGKVVAGKDQASFFRTLKAHQDGTVSKAGGYFRAAGVSAGITGWGFKLGIMDDWVKDEIDAISPRGLLRRIGQYTKSFETRQEGNAGIIAIGTMWDDPDWLDWLFELWTDQGHEPVWLRFPALSDDTAKYPLHESDPRSEGSNESLWPARFSNESQQKKKTGLVTRDKNAWYALQQQNPLRIAGQLFPARLWNRFSVVGEHALDLRQLNEIHFSVDGNLKATGSSWAVIGVYGIMVRGGGEGNTPVKHYFRLDEGRGHFEFSELCAETLRLWDKWLRAYPQLTRAGRVWVEDKANGPALMSQLAGRGIPFRAVPKMREKVACYRLGQLPLLEGRCWLPSDSDGVVTNHWVDGNEGFVSELKSQPSDPNDRADEFSQIVICNDPNLGIRLMRC